MSRATKRKHVIREVLVEDIRPPTKEQTIVQVLAGRGNNLHLVAPAAGEPFLASMPTKFRRNLWIKRGDYLLVEPIPEGDKVKAEIVTIITRDHKKYYCELGIWPPEFDNPRDVPETQKNVKDDDSTSEEEDLFVNTNRQMSRVSDSDETSGNESGSEVEERTEDSGSDDSENDDDDDDDDVEVNKHNADEKCTIADVGSDRNSKCQSDKKENDVFAAGGVR